MEVGFDLEAALDEGRLLAEGRITGLDETAIHVDGDGPLQVSLLPLRIAWPEHEPGHARLQLDGRVETLWPFVPIDPHRLVGDASGEITLSGTRAAPELIGNLTLRDGAYEHLITGAVFQNVEADLAAEGSRIRLVRAAGVDPEGGRVSATGEVDLQSDAPRRALADITLESARLIRRDTLSATADGTLSITADATQGVVSGDIETVLVEAQVVSELPPDVIELEVEELHAPVVPGGEPQRLTASPAGAIAMDVALTLPRRVFLRGRGLDSEWAGTLHVGGTADQPTITGVLQPVRGDFAFAGARFVLREGKVQFQGGEQLDPILDLTAEYETTDLTATLRLRGPASALDIALTSRPALPQDEILSRVLFGKSAGSLSPLEAVQLADAASNLSGARFGTASLFDAARGILRVDVFRADTDEENGAMFTAGRYIGDRLFIGIEQGTRARSTGVTAEVEVTKNITVEGDIGQTRGSGIGIKWKRNY